MGESFGRALRTELESENPIAFAVVLAAIYAFTDSWAVVVTIPTVLLGLAAFRALLTTLDAPEYVSGVVVGGAVAAVCAVVAALEFSWLYVVLAAGGGWLCLDSLYDRRHGIDRSEPVEDPMAELSFRESMETMSEMREIVETLRESPVALTPHQIADRTAYSTAVVEERLALLDDGSPVERVADDRYTVDESQMGASSLVRDAVRRFVRPFSVLVPGR